MKSITTQKRFLHRSKYRLLIRHDDKALGDFPLLAQLAVPVDSEPIRQTHLHGGLEVGLCHEGQGYLMAEDKVFSVKAGDVSIVSQAEAHAIRSTKGTTSIWSFVRFDPARLIGIQSDFPPLLQTAELAGPNFPNVLPGEDHPRITKTLDLLLDELRVEHPGRDAAVRGLVCCLLVHLHRLPEVSGTHATRTPDAIERVSPAIRWMESHYGEDLSMAELARLCHLSESHFRKVFREATGISALRYLTNVRLHMGAYRLRTTRKTILEIAYEVGYANVSSFNRHFKRFFRRTPRQWRAEVVKLD